MATPAARAIVAQCLAHRVAGPATPWRDSLDLVMHGHGVKAEDFGRDAIPPAPFALVIAAAFDAGRAQTWFRMAAADRTEQAALLTLWAREVWPWFVSRYGLD
ncbi:MAG: hypothetical protein HZC37_27410 [Burkholderiales bacterium]|nr:hypothetical protein [Burkholderiales bacterium]